MLIKYEINSIHGGIKMKENTKHNNNIKYGFRYNELISSLQKKNTKIKLSRKNLNNLNNAVNDVIKWIHKRINEMAV